MEREREVLRILKKHRIDAVAVLPCEKIKRLIWELERCEDFEKIHLLKEEDGVGVCAGISLCGGRPAMVIQSSGLGNAFNALLSLSVFYRFPLPIIASWRGVYKEKIDAQIPFNRRLPEVLDAFSLRYRIIRSEEDIEKIDEVFSIAFEEESPVIALISPEFWEHSSEKEEEEKREEKERQEKKEKREKREKQEGREGREEKEEQKSVVRREGWKRSLRYERDVRGAFEMTRFDAIRIIASFLREEVVVSNIGVPSKELFSVADRALNFYMLGSYSQVACIGLGISLRTTRDVFVLEGDGSMLSTSIYPVIAEKNPENLTIFCLDNGTFGSTGDQQTQAFSLIDLELVAKSFGIEETEKVRTPSELKRVLERVRDEKKPKFVHVLLKPGNASVKNIPLKPDEIKNRFRAAIREAEK